LACTRVKGAITVGADADFAIIAPDKQWTFQRQNLEARSGMSPYLGREFTGQVVRTIVRGRTVFLDGSVVGEMGWGQLVKPNHAN